MPRILAPLLSAATYARWLHLMIGPVFVGVVLMVWPGIEGWSRGELLARAVPVDAALLGLAALVPATRRAEGVQARLLLVPDRERDIAVEPSRSWADRRRTAAWLVGRVLLGGLVGWASVLVPATVVDLVLRPGTAVFGLRADGADGPVRAPLLALVLAPVLLFGLGWLVVWGGRLQLAMAVRLLGPSPAERLAAAELRAERLLERNLLARELHDSIGHALTVTVLQAGAAREGGDPEFAARALEVIEETGRRAMDDLERTLALLRDPADQGVPGVPGRGADGDRDARERPGIDRLPALFETARAAGSPVEARVDVPAGALPGVLSREGYRIVQEGVTNALKYAPGEPISVRVAVRDGSLELCCANALRPPSARSHGGSPRRGGKGLRGIRERAVLLGGEAAAGVESGDWVLTVRVPLRLGG
ncbi:Signal transduction histidine kinase [Streptomyces sp. TLI_053]|uniref:sensor histidine kinase n=1 Tax=Streptomyces sp. TLI_053 TaxID=1855352 RepID=UPI00087B083A|nr:histidine kinase [Streptomyces sp. TLI_053]SDT34747.1 Signal transduction histidine kinase [Streptomyces sp. TLI_053]